MRARVSTRGGLRKLADAGTGGIAPGAAMRSPVDARGVDPGLEDRRGAGRGRASGAAPAVARCVDDHADAGREAGRDEARIHVGGEALLVDVRVPLVEVRGDGLSARSE